MKITLIGPILFHMDQFTALTLYVAPVCIVLILIVTGCNIGEINYPKLPKSVLINTHTHTHINIYTHLMSILITQL